MIEVIYKGEKGEHSEEREGILLPKNVRQVGEVQRDRKVYIEDYVVTYMKQKITENKNLGCILILMGHREYAGENLYLFVDGAFAVDYSQVGGDYVFSDRVWEAVYETIKQYFISSEIVGWMLYDDDLTEDRLQKAQKKNFPAEDMLLIKQEAYDDESLYYLYRNGMLHRMPGFFVYYEKNEAMQEFMVSHYQSESVKEEKVLRQREAPVASFRSRMKERQESPAPNRLMGAMYAISSFLILIVIIIGITMVNNYDKMKTMEHSLNELASEAAGEDLLASAEDENEAAAEAQTEGAGANAALDDASGDTGQAAGQAESAHVELAEAGVEPIAQSDESEAASAEAQSTESSSTAASSEETGAETVVYYTIQPGETLAAISRRVYGNVTMVAEICAVNGIENGDKIQAGQKIILP